MAEISKLNLTGSDLDIKDSVAREKLTVVDPNAGQGLITFGVDANGNYGYKKVGADAVTPFLSNNAKDIGDVICFYGEGATSSYPSTYLKWYISTPEYYCKYDGLVTFYEKENNVYVQKYSGSDIPTVVDYLTKYNKNIEISFNTYLNVLLFKTIQPCNLGINNLSAITKTDCLFSPNTYATNVSSNNYIYQLSATNFLVSPNKTNFSTAPRYPFFLILAQ